MCTEPLHLPWFDCMFWQLSETPWAMLGWWAQLSLGCERSCWIHLIWMAQVLLELISEVLKRWYHSFPNKLHVQYFVERGRHWYTQKSFLTPIIISHRAYRPSNLPCYVNILKARFLIIQRCISQDWNQESTTRRHACKLLAVSKDRPKTNKMHAQCFQNIHTRSLCSKLRFT